MPPFPFLLEVACCRPYDDTYKNPDCSLSPIPYVFSVAARKGSGVFFGQRVHGYLCGLAEKTPDPLRVAPPPWIECRIHVEAV